MSYDWSWVNERIEAWDIETMMTNIDEDCLGWFTFVGWEDP